MKAKTKQLIINIITIINLILIGLFVYYLMSNNKYNLNYINKVSNKLEKYNNFMVEIDIYDVDTGIGENKKILQTENARMEEDKNEIRWYYENKIIVYTKNNETKGYINSDYTKIDSLRDTYDFWQYDYADNCKFLKKEMYNKKKCVVLEIENNNDSYKYRIWIDIENKLLLKQEIYKSNILNKTIQYNTHIDSVTNEDISVPDLTDYELLN